MTEALAPLLIVNPYGLFATTTTTRPVIVIEGSDDNQNLARIRAAVSAGAGRKARRPGAFPISRASTGSSGSPPMAAAGQQQWIERLLRRLLEGSPVVLALFAENPFGEAPPKHVRALLYDYRFADARSRRSVWWVRRLAGTYYPAVSLD